MKRNILILAVMMMAYLSNLWAYEFSSSISSGQTLYFNIVDGNAQVTFQNNSNPRYTSLSGAIVIPEQVTNSETGNTYTVTSISNNAFTGCTGITSVTLPNTLTSIGNNAFDGCIGISSVAFPISLTTIGGYSFQGCTGITTLTIPSHINYIGRSAFKGCSSLETVNFNATQCNTMGEQNFAVFENCSRLVEVNIDTQVTKIPKYAFKDCTKITSITIPAQVSYIGMRAFNNCTSLETVNYNPSGEVTVDNEAVFAGCSSLSTINFGSGVTRISDRLFSYITGLTSIVIPNSVTYIGWYSFCYCTNLQSVYISDGISYISTGAFSSCTSLRRVHLPVACTGMGGNVFQNCTSLESIVIPQTMTTIGSYSFAGCNNLKTVYNLSNLAITKGNTNYGNVAEHAERVSKCSNYGTGANAIHRIDNVNNSTSYSVVADDLAADGQNDAQEIPESTLPDNFIYSNDNGITWRAKNIVLTDSEDAFNAPVAFIAESATYTRVLTDQNRSTLCLPFTVAKPDDLEVFEYVAFDNSTLSFLELEGENIVAYTPYLVGKNISSAAKATSTFVFSQSNAEFPATSLTEVTHNNMIFKGAMERTPMTSDRNYGYKDGYFVQSGGSAHVNPFRCYFTDNNPQPNPSSLGVDITENGRLGIDEVHPSSQMIIRYSNDVYDLMGRMVRKNAESLRGLPKGIYIWKGQKVFNNR